MLMPKEVYNTSIELPQWILPEIVVDKYGGTQLHTLGSNPATEAPVSKKNLALISEPYPENLWNAPSMTKLLSWTPYFLRQNIPNTSKYGEQTVTLLINLLSNTNNWRSWQLSQVDTATTNFQRWFQRMVHGQWLGCNTLNKRFYTWNDQPTCTALPGHSYAFEDCILRFFFFFFFGFKFWNWEFLPPQLFGYTLLKVQIGFLRNCETWPICLLILPILPPRFETILEPTFSTEGLPSLQ